MVKSATRAAATTMTRAHGSRNESSSRSSPATTPPRQQQQPTNQINQERLALWSASLEMWCHQILSVRQVYPKETFCNIEFLSATAHCKANRHPGVISYISEAIKIAVPALLVDGLANEFSMVILQQSDRNQELLLPPRQLEKYTLDFSEISKKEIQRDISSSSCNSSTPFSSKRQPQQLLHMEDFEREMLDLVLSVHTLGVDQGGQGSFSKTSNITFKLMLHVPSPSTWMENDEPHPMPSSELKKALSEGSWYFPSGKQQNQQRKEDRLRPIHDISLPNGRVHFSWSYYSRPEQPQQQQKKKRQSAKTHKVSFQPPDKKSL